MRYLLFLLVVSEIHAASPDRVEGEWILRLRRGDWSSVSVAGLERVREFGPENRYALFWGKMPRMANLSQDIASIQPNYLYYANDVDDPDFEKSWALKNTGQTVNGHAGIASKDIGAVDAWAIHKGAPTTIVAVIDTGIDDSHEDLKNNMWRNKNDNSFGWNFVANSANTKDDNNHGTFCAGIIGAEGGNARGSRGINWKVRLMAVKFLDANGSGTSADAVSAIEYAVKNGASIINASWGGANYDPALFDMIKWAGEKDVLFIAASGNDGKNNDTDAKPVYPASFGLANIISVAAYNNRDELAEFSNFGKESVHLGAPGVDIYSSIAGGYKFGEGTSYAAPFVSGVAALVKSYQPYLSSSELKDRLLQTSEVIAYYEKEKTRTAGRVHAYNALKDIRPPRPVAPTHWTRYTSVTSTAHPYLNKTHQTFRFEHPRAKNIRVHFSSFETESCCDEVTLRDRDGKVVVIYSGDLGSFSSADALGNKLDIEFRSDYSITKNGFDIDYYEVTLDGDWLVDLLRLFPFRLLWKLS